MFLRDKNATRDKNQQHQCLNFSRTLVFAQVLNTMSYHMFFVVRVLTGARLPEDRNMCLVVRLDYRRVV